MPEKTITHLHSCTCSNCTDEQQLLPVTQNSRRDFFKNASLLTAGAFMPPSLANAVSGDAYHQKELFTNGAVKKGKANVFTLLHTSDIHAQLYTHDEFFWENNQPVYKKRGGFAVLKTMLQKLKAENPANTVIIDGGDCFQGSGTASLSEGQAIIPLINNIGYDLILPGNWEVVYGKEMMRKDLGAYNSAKICANMFHDTNDEFKNEMIFPPYWTKIVGGVKIGFIGYNDPLTPKRQSPAYSKGITFTKPEVNVKKYINILRKYEQCAMVFLVTHMGLAQQIDLANKLDVQGVDYILGADTHERVRKPIQGTYAKVTEPGAFGSFVARLDVVIENGKIKDENYHLLDVDPEKYKPDAAMRALIEKVRQPYKQELNKVIGKTAVPLVRYYVLENPMDNLVTDAMHWKYKDKVDFVASNGFRFCPPLIPDPKKGYAEITNDFLWSMMPVESDLKIGEISGIQLREWLEKELHNVFAKNPAQRFGGWMVRLKGITLNFTVNREAGKRINSILVNGKAIDENRMYTMLGCERDGDPDDTICRIEHVSNPRKTGEHIHTVIRDYLAAHPLVSPKIEGKVTATDAPANLLSQLEGYDYIFR